MLIGSILALGVGWVLVSIAAAFGSGNAALYWVILAVGIALLVLVLAGVIVYLFLTVKAIALSQRQSNFIDSVTHELKSPLASLKLYLQTLDRRPVSPEQQADFHRFMLKDVERLDHRGKQGRHRPDQLHGWRHAVRDGHNDAGHDDQHGDRPQHRCARCAACRLRARQLGLGPRLGRSDCVCGCLAYPRVCVRHQLQQQPGGYCRLHRHHRRPVNADFSHSRFDLCALCRREPERHSHRKL